MLVWRKQYSRYWVEENSDINLTLSIHLDLGKALTNREKDWKLRIFEIYLIHLKPSLDEYWFCIILYVGRSIQSVHHDNLADNTHPLTCVVFKIKLLTVYLISIYYNKIFIHILKTNQVHLTMYKANSFIMLWQNKTTLYKGIFFLSSFLIILFLVRSEPFEAISLWFEKFDNKKLIWCEKFNNISNNCFDTHHTKDQDLSSSPSVA